MMTLARPIPPTPEAAPPSASSPIAVGAGPVAPRAATALTPLPFTAIRLREGFLHDLQARNAAALAHGQTHLEDQGAWTNFTNAAADRSADPYHGPVFEDGEAFKWLEAVGWQASWAQDPLLEQWLQHYTALVAEAQDPDGYLATFNQTAGQRGRYEWMSYDHEIFNMATMLQAAVAQHRATGSSALLAVAERAADHLEATFGWGKREETCGHPLVEMALVELYRTTGQRRYLDLASFFVEVRGRGTLHDPTAQHWESSYFSDRVPVREATSPEGHAVRAVYFAAGATDVALETGDDELMAAVQRLWAAMVDQKAYVNGGLGARWSGESFGDPYELPSERAYGETCAAIASVQWSWRLLLATGEAKYADLIERQLYNAVLSGVSQSGQEYFYVNALQVREGALVIDSRMPAAGRQPWFGCSCCPTNIMRTLATLHTLAATTTEGGVQVHQYASGHITTPSGVRLAMSTAYPWRGEVHLEVLEAPAGPWELKLRIPAWAHGATVHVTPAHSPHGHETDTAELAAADHDAVDPDSVDLDAVNLDVTDLDTTPGTYAAVSRQWRTGDVVEMRLPVTAALQHGRHRVDAERGAVVVRRGPLVYAFEQVDQVEGVTVDDLHLHTPAVASTNGTTGAVGTELRERWDERLGGVPLIEVPVRLGPAGPRSTATAIPYFLWANREVGPMRVWLPLSPAEEN